MSKINNINRRKFLELIGCGSCGLILDSCGTAPITDRKQLKLLPESTINRQAAQIYENVKAKTKLSDDKKQLDEIKEIGNKTANSVSKYFDSINEPDPTYNFQWEYILIDNDKLLNLLNSKTSYKWNINKNLAYFFAFTIIKKILSERNNNIIRLDELTQLINKRYKETNDFIIKKTRKPRILIVKLGQDGHDRGANVVASAYEDLGFDVKIGPLFQTPQESSDMVGIFKPDVVGASSLAGGHLTLIPEMIKYIRNDGHNNVLIIAGGVIPQEDYAELEQAGVDAIFGPGTNITDAARRVLGLIEQRPIKN